MNSAAILWKSVLPACSPTKPSSNTIQGSGISNQPNRSAHIAALAAILPLANGTVLLRRITNRFNSQVNGYFLCDRGRFGYEYVNSDKRIKRALVRPELDRAKPAQPEGVPQILEIAADRLRRARGIVGIGSPRASVEANVALRSLVGPQQFFLGIDEQEHQLLSTHPHAFFGPDRCLPRPFMMPNNRTQSSSLAQTS